LDSIVVAGGLEGLRLVTDLLHHLLLFLALLQLLLLIENLLLAPSPQQIIQFVL
jgi:hypothetical protein